MTEYLKRFRDKMAGEDTRLYLLEEVDSTNTFAKSLRGSQSAVVLAARQTGGRGRWGRAWNGQPDDLYMSLYYSSPVKDLLGLTLIAALAVVDTVDKFCEGVGIKWPNDILVHGKKLVGILAESVFLGREPQAVVIGVGINVNADGFEGELAQKAISIKMASGRLADTAEVAFCLKKNMDRYFSEFCREGFAPMLSSYTERSVMIGRQVTVFNKCGICRGFSDRGGILLQQGETPIEEAYFGEASF